MADQAPAEPQEAVEHDREAQPVDREEPPRLPFPVVGIGASAGGLEAFFEFFEAVPAKSGAAYVLVQHLLPDGENLLVDLLSGHTTMPVHEVVDGMPVEVDHVYVIRPGRTLTLHQGRLHLGEPLQPRVNNRPVDDFFRSLAEEQRERAICIVMSGMGSNGTEGSRMVSAVGGLCIAQDPESAKYPSMPRHLVEQGNADFVLRPRDMPEALLAYATQPYAQNGAASSPERESPQIEEILAVIRSRTKRDFTGYKRQTVTRRIRRRMGVHQLRTVESYAQMLRKNTAEASALADDLLIHVTGFFRDPEAWDALLVDVVEPLVAAREDNGAIRCWVTACATGEEAYSLAMLIDEAATAAGKRFDVKVFATDMAQRALAHARAGIYANGIESDVSAERLDRYFQRDDGYYRVNSTLRSMVVFAPQNVLQDPPFSRLDICSCRNMLIYLEPAAQARLLQLLHFGLREDGVLFLGTSETPGTDDLFEPIDRRWRIYRRLENKRRRPVDFSHSAAALESAAPDLLPRAAMARLTAQWLADGQAAASVTVDGAGHVVFFHGDTQIYLRQPRGEPTRELLSLVREGLSAATRTALEGAVSKGETFSLPSRMVSAADGRHRAWVTASPLEVRADGEAHYLVSFEQRLDPAEPEEPGPNASTPELHHELDRMRQELQRTVTELQIRNEELRASNEEVTSINEELQSTNEELETSKEELQSLNEELTTVNAQLQAKVQEHEATTNDLSSLLLSTDIAVIFLDRQFRIRRFTPAVRDLMELIPTDAGRPLENLARKFVDPQLLSDARQVLERLVPLEQEVRSHSGRWYLRRLLPYRTTDNHIDGVVITFIDLSKSKRAEEGMAEKARLLDLSGDAIIACDVDSRILFWSLGATRQFGYEPDEARGHVLPELLQSADYPPPGRLLETAGSDTPLMGEVVSITKSGKRIVSLCRWAVDTDADGKPDSILLSSTDVTESRLEREALRQGEEQFRLLVDGARDYAMLLMDPDGIITAWNIGAERVLGYTEAEAVGQSIALIFTPEDRKAGAHHRERAAAARDGRAEDARWHMRKDGQRFFSNGVMNSLRRPDGSVRGYVKILRDDTARKLAEESLKNSAEQAASANRMKDTFLATLSHELRTPLAAIQLWAHVLRKQDVADLEGRARAVVAIVQSAQAQNQLIDDLLDTVRIASGALRIDVQACELAPLLHAWVDSIRLTAEAKNVELRVEVGADIGMVATDPDRLQQVLWNLLKNAVTFTPSGGRVSVAVQRLSNHLEIRVSDTGAGIAPEFLAHVFEAFRQADSSNARVTGGLGLGLSIVWKLVHLLGGTVRAESPGLGHGATFTVRLPSVRTAPAMRRPSQSNALAVQSNLLRGRHILLVEDTTQTREALALILRGAGAEVRAAADATEAFSAFLQQRPSLIVSDIALPGEDGYAFLRKIRAHESENEAPTVPAVAVTALAHQEDRAQILEAGFDGHMIKPFEAEVLILMLAELLAEKS